MSDRLEVRKTYKLFVGGAFPRSESGRTYEVVSADGTFLANAAKGSRKDGRDAGSDSQNRERQLGDCLGKCLTSGDKVTSVDEAWDALHLVDRGGRSFGTLHSLVFRHEPWCFELRIAEPGDKGLGAAPVSSRRYALTRQQVFADGELLGK